MTSGLTTIDRTRGPGAFLRGARAVPRWSPSARQARWGLLFALGTGLLLWEPLPLAWAFTAPVLVAHVLGSLLALGMVVVPFWLRHRTRLRFSRNRSMTWTGRAIELGLAGLVLSGLYLFLVGNPGAWPGRVAHELHLWLTLPLWIALSMHAGMGMRVLASRLIRTLATRGAAGSA